MRFLQKLRAWLNPEKAARMRFCQIFGFSPDRLEDTYLRKEMIAILAEKARSVRNWTSYDPYRPDVDEERRQAIFRHVRYEFDDLCALVAKFDSERARAIPHWSEFPEPEKGWLLGTEVDLVPGVGIVVR